MFTKQTRNPLCGSFSPARLDIVELISELLLERLRHLTDKFIKEEREIGLKPIGSAISICCYI